MSADQASDAYELRKSGLVQASVREAGVGHVRSKPRQDVPEIEDVGVYVVALRRRLREPGRHATRSDFS